MAQRFGIPWEHVGATGEYRYRNRLLPLLSIGRWGLALVLVRREKAS